jgi:hypothetical protein
MRKVFALSLFFSFALLSFIWQEVNAASQAATQTPLEPYVFSTATPVPATATPTPPAPCPTQAIQSVEALDPGWLATCGHCVQTPTATSQYVIGTVQPTWNALTPSPSATPLPSASPTASVTPTQSPIVIETVSSASNSWVHNGGQYWLGQDIYYDSQISGYKIGFVYLTTGNVGSCSWKRMGSDMWTNTSDDNPVGGLDGRLFVSMPLYTSNEWSLNGLGNAFASQADMDDWVDSHFGADAIHASSASLILGPGDNNVWARWELGWSCTGTVNVDVVAIIGYGSLSQQETATPEPSASCSEPVYRNETPIVDYGGFDQLGSTCYTLIPGFSFTIPSIFGLTEEFTLSADTYQLCVQWYSFPELSILDITIPLDLVILPAAVWLFRRFMEL